MAKVIPIRLGDEAARERIRGSLDESLVVEAAAGTGKTSELVNRVVSVLRQGRAQVNRIVAVTFTRKAAGELKLRLRQELDRALQEARGKRPEGPQSRRKGPAAAPGDIEIENLERSLSRLEEARIGTIHSFCAEILRERPVEANVDPAFQELSEPEARRLYRQAFQRWSQEKLSASPPGLRRCLSRLAFREYQEESSPLDQIQNAGWKLIEWRDFPKVWTERPFEREPAIDGLVNQTLELADASSRCPRPHDNLFQDLEPVRSLAEVIRRKEAVSKRDYDTLEGLLIKLLREFKTGRKRKGTGTFAEGASRESVIEARGSLVQALEDFKYRADADLAALLQGEMLELVARYDELKRASGKLDFVDLLLQVRNLVRGNRQVRLYLQDQFTHIFVDEFQDTDPLQAEILLLLSADDPEETNWLRVRPAEGKLFLVGDPKQSVYRFRRADVVLYQKLRDALTAKGIGLVHLTRSFRAVRPIQECINAAFAGEMTGSAAAGQSDYVPLEEYAKAIEGQPTVIALPVPHPYGGGDRVTKRAVNEGLPEAVAAFVHWLIHRSGWKVREPGQHEARTPVSSRHVCLLFRRFVSWGTDVTREYLRALEVRNVPHLLVGARSFHSREEVETLRAALTAVEWPDDELAVFATLKGSLFAISDSVLLRFKQQFERIHPFRPLPPEPDADFQPLAEALRLLADLHRHRNSRPIVETVNILLETTRAHAGFAMRPAGNQVLANVYHICDLARSFETGGGISFRGFIEELQLQAEREEGGEAPVLEEGAEGVRIMTVHGAKGLEFPVVILADIGCGLAAREPDMYVDGEQNLCAMRLVGCAPWELQDHQQQEKERDRAEGVRVAYVAATRARDLLVIPAVEDQAAWEEIFRNWGDGWLAPLHKAIYPSSDRRRKAQPAPGCPPFGEITVIANDDRLLESSIKPGLHRPAQGTHSVVWWDPATLDLKVEGNFGLRQAEVLQEDEKEGGQSLRRYEAWKAQRAQTLEEGQRAEFSVLTPTETAEVPASFQVRIEVESLPKPVDRPRGARFGTLVHAILRDADLRPEHPVNDDDEYIEALGEIHGRVLGSTPEEVAAAIQAVSNSLKHPLLRRASVAERCHRELPIMAKTESGKLLEGNIDLAFVDDGTWTIVDFKSDADLPAREAQYRRQLQWYAFALSQITGAPARGVLLSI